LNSTGQQFHGNADCYGHCVRLILALPKPCFRFCEAFWGVEEMPLWWVVVIYSVLLLIVLAASPLFLWLGARWWRVPNVSFRRCLAVSLCLLLVNLVFTGLFIALERLPSMDPDLPRTRGQLALCIVVVVIFLALVIGTQVFLIKRMLRARFWPAVLVFLTEMIASTGIGYGVALGTRAVMLEAFVAPTNSMAPTIIGNHSDLVCANCGFTYSIAQRDVPDRWQRDPVVTICPNCGSANTLAAGAPIKGGDRFFVDKLRSPRRWDCVVFWAPDAPNTLYVKRLIGLPGETISLSGGHVFADGKLVRRDLATASDLWRPTCDTRFIPSTISGQAPHWALAVESKWRKDSTTWSCDAKDGDGGELRLEGEIVDGLDYLSPGMGGPTSPSHLFTGDIKLDCTVGAFDGSGGLSVRWEFDGQKVVATFQGDGKVTVERFNGPDLASDKTKAEGQLTGHGVDGRMLTFAVRDGVAYACENGKPIVTINISSDSLADQKQEPPQSRCRLVIAADQCDVSLPRISLAQQIGFRTVKEIGMDTRAFARPVSAEGKLAADEYYLLGDYSERSKDSRLWGPIKRNAFFGVARWIYWPIERWHEFQ
jgi:type IV secretory pathway protease TraF